MHHLVHLTKVPESLEHILDDMPCFVFYHPLLLACLQEML